MKKFYNSIGLTIAAGFLSILSGCSSVYYFYQAGRGQLAITNLAKPITDVVEDERTPQRIKMLLGEVKNVIDFTKRIGLKKTPNYRDYVQLNREYANYVVTASEKLKFKARQWSFPIVGTFNYIGYFSEVDANEHGKRLSEEGLDVYVRGARAYSTLGWFRDPIMSSMLLDGDGAFGYLVNVLIHESVHATFYVNGQSYFNESAASYIADRTTSVYLKDRFGESSKELEDYQSYMVRSEKNGQLFRDLYFRLKNLYDGTNSDQEKFELKDKWISELKIKLDRKDAQINNASLTQFRTYGVGKAEFDQLFNHCHGDWVGFTKKLTTVEEVDFAETLQTDFGKIISKLTATAC